MLVLLALLPGLPGGARAGDGVGVTVKSGDALTAHLDAGDSDAFAVDLSEGGSLSLKLKYPKGATLVPSIRLFRPDGVEAIPGAALKLGGTTKASLSKFVPAAGTTGTWKVLLGIASGDPADYTASFKTTPPKAVKSPGLTVPAGGTLAVEVTGDSGALLTVAAVLKAGPAPVAARLLDPDGVQVPGSASLLLVGPKGVSGKSIPVNRGFGRYVLEIDGAAGGSATVDATVSAKFAKGVARKEALPAEATISLVAPPVLRQEDASVDLAITGTNLLAGSSARLGGSGISVVSASVSSSTQAVVRVTVAADADLGDHDLLFCPPPLEGEPILVAGAVLVEAPVPTVTGIAVAVLRQGEGPLTLTVTGTRFRAGGVVTIGGTGLTVGATTFLSPTQASVPVTAAAGALVGPRDVTFTQAVAAGGASGTGTGILRVNDPDPILTSISPVTVRQGDSGVMLTLTGNNFRTGGTVTAGSGVTVTNPNWISDTSFQATLAVGAAATFGGHDIVYTHPAGGGGAAVTLTASLTVKAPIPTVTSISPVFLAQGATGTVITLTGTNFRSGATASFGTGISVTETNLVSATSLQATVTADLVNATLGAHDVVYTQPVAGGSDAATLAGGLQVNAPTPTVTSISPTSLTQGASGTTITLTGTNFRAGGTASFGTGITVTGTSLISATSFQATVDAGLTTATMGAHDVVFTQAAGAGGASGTLSGGLQVNAPPPTVTSLSPVSLTQGATGTLITLTGTNFRSGGTASFGTGITVTGTNFVSTTTFQATVDADLVNATLGAHDAVYTHPAGGGGGSGTKSGALQVNAPVPTIGSVSPTTTNATSFTLTVNGTNFRTGGAVTSTGLTMGATTIVSALQATVPVTVPATTAAGLRGVTYTHPAAGGGAAVTLANSLTVNYPNPTVTSISPTTINQGSTGFSIALTGTGFRSDGSVTLSGTGLTVVGQTWNSDTSDSISVDATAGATLSARDVTYTQNASGGGAAATLTGGLTVTPSGPTLASITPSAWRPGDTRLTAALVGTNYNSGTAVTLSGAGITVHSTTFVSATALRMEFSVASNAAVGARNLTITPGSGGGSPATFNGAVTIVPADPTVTSFSRATLAANASISATVRGTNFRTGDVLSASGSGVSFSSVSVVDATTITATTTVASGAATGARSLTVSHAASEGGRSGTLASAFTVVSGSPTVTAVVPAVVGRTASGGPTRTFPVTVTGTNFASGATLSASKSSGSGVSVVGGSTTVVDGTTVTATLSVAGAATTGAWNLILTNPDASAGTGTNLLTVNDENTLAVNAVSPASGTTRGGERVTVYGSGFLAGAVVDFGAARAVGTLVIDVNTLVTTVPSPASVSTTAATPVGVKVTNTSGSPTNVTLAAAYSYARDADTAGPTVVATIPSAASGNPANLRNFVFVLSEDELASSVGSTTSFDWFGSPSQDIGSSRVLSVGAGAGRRLVSVLRNATPASLSTSNTYFVNLPNTVKDLAGNALDPTPFSGSVFQASFTVAASTDSTAPALTSITPSNGATGIVPGTTVVIVFTEAVDPVTVTTTNITFKQGSTVIAGSLSLGTDARTVTIVPETGLTASTTYTTNVTAGVKDLCGNAYSNTSYTFTTAGSDTIIPTVDTVVLERIPSSMDGSGTFVDKNNASQAFDLYLPRFGWLVEVTYSDAGSGIDETNFSAKANVAVGGNSANAELASNFAVTSTGASWRIPSAGFAAGDGATLTFTVKDKAGNSASTRVVTFNVADITSTATGDPGSAGTSGGDLDPFGTRQTWILRSDIDAYTAVFSTPSSQQGATTTVAANNLLDLDESLRLVGLNTGSMTANAAACVNGTSLGTNAILRRLFMERLRALLRAHYGIAEDGTYGADSMNIEFLLQGEQGSLASLPTYGSSNSSSTTAAFSEMSIGGTQGAEAGATTTSGVLATAYLDGRNNRQEDNLNFGVSGNITGTYLLAMLKLQVNSSTGTTFRTRVSNKFVAVYGGTPGGEGALDDVVLAGTFVRSAGTGAQQARYDDLMDAVELVASYAASVTAHEIGHSTGLVMNKIVSGTPGDGAPKTGLFGNAHFNNAFTEATSGVPNTSFHMNFLGNDTMSASTSFEAAVGTGTNFQLFSPLDRAYLLRRLIHDEGK